MPAKNYKCTVTKKKWIAPTVFILRFKTKKLFMFDAGQFLSVNVPVSQLNKETVKRAYSFATSFDEVKEKKEYELCIRLVEDGAGSTFMSKLSEGDEFSVSAPYGDFVFHPRTSDRFACFISTGTGIAPLRAMVASKAFSEGPPKSTLCLFGASAQTDIIYQKFFESHQIKMTCALSKPGSDWTGFKGRVTDYLATLPVDWPWHKTDYYLCGNGRMIHDVKNILCNGHGISEENIFSEAYFDSSASVQIKIAA